jgi:hypothetical protein
MIRFPFRSTSRNRSALALVAVLTTSGGVHAQNPPSAGTATAEAQLTPQAPTDRAFSPFTGAQITATSDSSTATLKLTSGSNRWLKSETTDPHTAVADVFTLALSSPLAKGGAPTMLGTLDGLTSASTVQFQYSQYRVGGFRWGTPDQVRLDQICSTAKANYEKRNQKPFTQGCSTGFVHTYDIADFEEYRNAFHTDKKPRPFTAFGVGGKVGYETHAYYDSTTLAKLSSNKTPMSGSAYYSWISANHHWAVTGEAQLQRAYKDTTAQIACPTGESKPTVTCVNGSLGPPTPFTKQLLSAELRGTLLDHVDIFGVTAVAIDPMITVDTLNSNTYGFDVPIYLFGGSAGLTGGVRADWDSDKRSLVVGIFISKPFSLFEHQ